VNRPDLSAIVRVASQLRVAKTEPDVARILARWFGAPVEIRFASSYEDSVGAFSGPLGNGRYFDVVVDCKLKESMEFAPLLRAATQAGLTGDPAASVEVLDLVERLTMERAHQLEHDAARLEADGRLVDNLREIGLRLTAQLDLDILVQDATDTATAATGAEFGAFFYNLIDEFGESYTLYTLSGVPRQAFEGFPMPRNTKVFAPTFTGEGTVRSDDITLDSRFGQNAPYHGMPEGHLPVRSYLAVSVVSPTSHQVLGGFFFGHSRPGRFTQAHERIAEGIAGYAAIGLDNARLYARERSVASDLQRQLLPEVTDAPGFTVVSRYLPAAINSEVGGDWLDVIELSGGRTAFVIGDVMGRGLRAASLMGQIRTAVRAYARLDLPPGELLRQASQLAAEMTGRQFITCAYAVHDPIDQTLTYANAGHPAPAVIAPSGEVAFLPERLGMPLRVGAVFEERVIPFPAGSAVVLFTDGLVERRGRTLPEGMEALRKALETIDGEDPASACDRMIADLTSGAHDDDVALLYARDDGVPRLVAEMELSTDAMAAVHARRFSASALESWGLSGRRDAVAMVVTELVSNAVRHSQSPRALRLHYAHGRLIVEVADDDDRQPRRIQAAISDENHRGLYIVDVLAQRWGARSTPTGKVVWAELPTT
jgi:hypothetical protein